MPHDNDYDNIQAYLRGDAAGFDRLYQRYRRPLFAYLNRMLPGQGMLVDDLYQQVWLKVLDNLPNYREQQRFSGWLFRIAHNLGVDYFRRQRAVAHVAVDEQLVAGEPRPGDAVVQQELQQALADAVADLPLDQREVVVLRRQGISFKEIAQIQQTTVNTALGRMHYAVKKLQSALVDFI